ncbi:MAG TPA: radical SAM protein [Syntrophales bacterium]|nr:radical SAM protein [Syntrophales bacterium]
MKREILFVNPWIHDFAAYDFWAKPLGLLHLAALVRRNGFPVRLVDCLDGSRLPGPGAGGTGKPKRKGDGSGHYPKEKLPRPEILDDIPRTFRRYGLPPPAVRDILAGIPAPALILVTAMMTYWYTGVRETINLLREVFPGVPVILGGNYASLLPDHARRHAGADRVVTGRGEAALPGLFREFLGEDLSFIPLGERPDDAPCPAFDLYPRLEQVSLLTSRGCPYRCTYCASAFLGGPFTARDPIAVVDEVAHWKRTRGVRHFAFYDDALLWRSAERAVPMMEEIIRRNLECAFHCPNGLHLREVTEKTARLMRKSGFRTIRFGFETANLRRQAETGGKVTSDETKEAVGHLRRAGYERADIGLYLLCGLPGQGAGEVREGIAFIENCGARPILAEYSPIPRTALWPEAVAASPFDIAREPLFQNNTLLPCQSGALTLADYRELKALTRQGPAGKADP